MAYALGQIVSNVLNRSFGQHNQSKSHRPQALAAKKPLRKGESFGVFVTLSAQARAMLEDMATDNLSSDDFITVPRTLHELDVHI